jgi:hypothetical protein
MRPSWDDLDVRDLRELAEACARAQRISVEQMFARSKRSECVKARSSFYGALDAQGWPQTDIARFVGRDASTINYALAMRRVIGLAARKRSFERGA